MSSSPNHRYLTSIVFITLLLASGLVGIGGGSDPGSDISPVRSPEEPVGVYHWPMMMGDSNHSGYSGSMMPRANKTLWNKPVPGMQDFMSPVYSDGVAYVGSGDGRLRGFNRTTGEEVFSIWIGNHPIVRSPIIVGDAITFGSENGHIYSYDLRSGDKLWETNLRVKDIQSSPVYGGGMIFIGSSNISRSGFFALNMSDGSISWSLMMNDTENFDGFRSDPAYHDGRIYLGDGWGDVYCLDADGFEDGNDGFQGESETGNGSADILWSFDGARRLIGGVMLAEGKTFIGDFAGYLHCFDAADGTHLWEKRVGSGRTPSISSTPGYHDGVLYQLCRRSYEDVGITRTGGSVVAVDPTTSDIIWRYNITETFLGSSPIITDDALLFGSEGSNVYCLNNSKERMEDEKRLIWRRFVGAWIRSTPAIGDGNVFMSLNSGDGSGRLMCFGVPDLRITNISVSDRTPFDGELVELTTRYENRGSVAVDFDVKFDMTTRRNNPKITVFRNNGLHIEPGEGITVSGEFAVRAGLPLLVSTTENVLPGDLVPLIDDTQGVTISIINLLEDHWTASGGGPEKDGHAGRRLDSNRTFWTKDLGGTFQGSVEPMWFSGTGGAGHTAALGPFIYMADPAGDLICLESDLREGESQPNVAFRYSNSSVDFVGRPALLIDADQTESLPNRVFTMGDDNGLWAFDWVGFKDGINDGPVTWEGETSVGDGDVVWRAQLPFPPAQPLLVSGGNALVVTSDSMVRAYDDDDGELEWAYEIDTTDIPISASSTRVYLLEGGDISVLDSATGAKTGTLNVSHGSGPAKHFTAFEDRILVSYMSSLALFDLTPDDNDDGIIDLNDSDDGVRDNSTVRDLIWNLPMEETLSSPPSVSADQYTFAVAAGNTVYFMDLINGTEISNTTLESTITGRIVSAGDSYYIQTGSSPWRIVAFTPEKGTGFVETWSSAFDSEPMGEGAISGSHMYLALRNGLAISLGASNTRPVAVIDSPDDGGMIFGGEMVTLDASSSYDPNGDSITYSWRLEGENERIYQGRSPLVLANITGVGRVKLQLTVYDDMRASSSTSVNLTILKRVRETHRNDHFETTAEISFGISEPNGIGSVQFEEADDYPDHPGIVQALSIEFRPIPRYAIYLHDWVNISMEYLNKELGLHREKLGIYRLEGGEWTKAPASGSDVERGLAWGNFSELEYTVYGLGILENSPPYLRHIIDEDYVGRSGTGPEYRFRVGYRDLDEDIPEYVRLSIGNEKYDMSPSGFLPNLTGYRFYSVEGVSLLPGPHSYHFEADDGYFITRTEDFDLLVENTKPVVEVVAPPSPQLVDTVLLFDATGSYDEDGDELSFSWDFDNSDGIEREKVGEKVDHTYDEEGVYTITVTVSDGVSEVKKEITLTVIEEEEEGSSQWYVAAIVLVSFILILLVAVVIVFNLSRNTAKEREDLTRGLQDKPWTCPECGKEVYPGVSECPDCGYEYDPLDFEDEPGGITIGKMESSDIFEDLEEIEE